MGGDLANSLRIFQWKKMDSINFEKDRLWILFTEYNSLRLKIECRNHFSVWYCSSCKSVQKRCRKAIAYSSYLNQFYFSIFHKFANIRPFCHDYFTSRNSNLSVFIFPSSSDMNCIPSIPTS